MTPDQPETSAESDERFAIWLDLNNTHQSLLRAAASIKRRMDLLQPPAAPEERYRIALRPDHPDGHPMGHDLLDDIVVNNIPLFRAEAMSDTSWWVACYLSDADRICWDVRARSKPLRIEWTVSEFPEEPVVYEHELEKP